MSEMPTARARRSFIERVGSPPEVVAFAPGRVNLIGEHTDYNDGFVLPMALTRGIGFACRPRADRRLRAYATDLGESVEVSLDGLEPRTVFGWGAYPAGVLWVLERHGTRLRGLDLVVASDLPVGAGLSSSAALEVATARAVCEVAGIPWDAVAIAEVCRRAENEFVGVPCGLMDQLASAASREGCATLLDCRSLAMELVPVPPDAAFVVMDSGVRRALATSDYAERRAACEEAVRVLKRMEPRVRALRDADEAVLQAARAGLDPIVLRRASHVVAENPRPAAMARSLLANDLAASGRLMNESHASLRDLFEVSCPELDLLCELARAHSACYGARMTGAGFGGCAIALVDRDGAVDFVRTVEASYRARGPGGEAFFATRPGAGARLA